MMSWTAASPTGDPTRDRYLAALVQVQREFLNPRAALDGLE